LVTSIAAEDRKNGLKDTENRKDKREKGKCRRGKEGFGPPRSSR
jgi:hypothetical protein